MIDLKMLREDPDRFRKGASLKRVDVDVDRLVELDREHRAILVRQERLRAEAKTLGKSVGPLIGRLGAAKGVIDDDLRRQAGAVIGDGASVEAASAGDLVALLKGRPTAIKNEIQALEEQARGIEPELQALLLRVPLPPDPDVPVGASGEDNVEIRAWGPAGFDTAGGFRAWRGFAPRTHIELVRDLGLADFERGVKLAGTRSYVLTGDGMRLHQAVLRYAFDLMVDQHGFTPMSVPVVVREEAMVGTGFFPAGVDQAYHVNEKARGGGHDLFLTGTGEVGLMGLRQNEILNEADLPLRMVTVSTCFRREAGAAGKDTAGLYRIHQFDKVEQVIIARADEEESRAHHKAMIGYVEAFLQSLGLPYRLLQCCTGDLGVKNADMIDLECWMPGRGGEDEHGRPAGAYGETHSASRLYDFQCRRLNMRYRPGGDGGKGPTTFCHSLNNTVAASPRILIPILEIHQNEDGTVTIPAPLRPYMGGRERIG